MRWRYICAQHLWCEILFVHTVKVCVCLKMQDVQMVNGNTTSTDIPIMKMEFVG